MTEVNFFDSSPRHAESLIVLVQSEQVREQGCYSLLKNS